ncbi:MAG: M48 family metalloprotease [Solirubrobacteraceae bacterium]
MALVVGTAELGAALLRPRPRPARAAAVDLGQYFSAQELARGARFARPQLAIAVAASAVQFAGVAAGSVRPPQVLGRLRARPLMGSAAVGAGMAVAATAASLPFSALARRRALAAGLTTQSWRGWMADLVKGTALEATFAAAGGTAVTAAVRRYPRGWWLVGAGGSVALGVLLALLGPVVLAPIFNDFDPLPEGETRSDVLELAAAAGVAVGEVYAVDASKRTNAANAYVTGLGPTKRVVLFDTLLDRYGRDEVRGVVAHELAHVRYRDVRRGIAFAAIVAGPAALATARLSGLLSAEAGTPEALPGLALTVALVSVPIAVSSSRLSRSIERRADAYSLELTRAPEAFISFERRIVLQNLADIDPPRWLQALIASHPPTAERIGAAVAFAARCGTD